MTVEEGVSKAVKGCFLFWDFNYSLWGCLNLYRVGSSNIRLFMRLFSPSLQGTWGQKAVRGAGWGPGPGSLLLSVAPAGWFPVPALFLTSRPCHRHPCLHPSPTSSLSILRSSSSEWGTTGREVTALTALTCPSTIGPGRQVQGSTKAFSRSLVICLSDGSPCLD